MENWDSYITEESAHADRDIAIMKQLLKKQKQVGPAFVETNMESEVYNDYSTFQKESPLLGVYLISGSLLVRRELGLFHM